MKHRQKELGLLNPVRRAISVTDAPVESSSWAAWMRLWLAAGSRREISVPVDRAAFSVVNDRGERVFDAAGATLYVGFGQPDARTAVLTGKHGVTLSLT